ncbi:hypothetical protein QYE76_053847 [Lolium multiflorum]|uniref:Reverse transcriptase zinc-binding domain-containing protein n=1 Tax=Lolium multiflorum TaxID=4521 RepID=A0AAD8SYB1_LOLMU|nr:hypothetical protein QYE76_053847 [Lolium multiflorum]
MTFGEFRFGVNKEGSYRLEVPISSEFSAVDSNFSSSDEELSSPRFVDSKASGKLAKIFSNTSFESSADSFISSDSDSVDSFNFIDKSAAIGKVCSYDKRFLGLPLSLRKLRKVDFQPPLLDRIASRLACWKAKLLSAAGRLVLLNAVLSALSVYWISVHAMSAWVRKEIDRIRRAWLWRGEETCHGGHCKVAWSWICRPRELGGLGIIDLDRFGTALRLKWLWMERTALDKPWIGTPVPCSLADRQLFAAASSVTIGDGTTARFWFDSWMDGQAPFVVFPELFVASRRKHRSVSEALHEQRWVADLRGRVTSQLLLAFVSLWLAVAELHPLPDTADTFLWRCTESGSYSASSAYRLQFLGSTRSPLLSTIWQAWAPAKCRLLAWMFVQNRVLTADRLMARRWPNSYFCPLCTSVKTQAMETKPMERELEMMKMELLRPGRNFRPPGPELPARFLQDAPKMPSSAQEKASDRNFRPEGPELPPGRFRPSSALRKSTKRPLDVTARKWTTFGTWRNRNFRPGRNSPRTGTSAPDRNFRPRWPELPPPRTSAQQHFSASTTSFRNINYDDGTPRIQAVHLTPSTIASSTSSATVIKCGEGNQLPMTRHQHWIATQAVHAKLNQFEAMLKDTNVRYEERAQVQRIDLNNQVQELNEKIETQGNELKATLAIQGHELLHRRIMIPIKTHATIMWMLKCFNNKLKKRSKHDFDLSKNVYALKKNAFNKNISMLNSKRNNNVFVMIKISFMHVSKKGSAKSKRHVIIKGNLAHLKWPMLKGTTIMPNKK